MNLSLVDLPVTLFGKISFVVLTDVTSIIYAPNSSCEMVELLPFFSL